MNKGLEEAQNGGDRKDIFDSNLAQERLNPIQKEQDNPKSLRLVINRKCFD